MTTSLQALPNKFELPESIPERSFTNVLKRMDQATRDRHKHLLTSLFLQVDQPKLQAIAKACERGLQVEGDNAGFADPSEEAEQAKLVSKVQTLNSLPTRSSQVERIRPNKRKNYSSRSLESLQRLVKTRFQASSLKYSRSGTFLPFCLEYNESSISTICKWADNRKSQSKRYIPVVSPVFRKCGICLRYGHYEIECEEIGDDDAITLAEQTKSQAALREISEKNLRHSRKLPFEYRHKSNDRENEDDQTSSLPKNENSPHPLTCNTCKSSMESASMLVCDNCNGLYHMFCANPPLRYLPKAGWSCARCKRLQSNTADSDVEIETYGDVVIEQRSKSSKSLQKGKNKSDHKDSRGHWQNIVTVFKKDTVAHDFSPGSVDSSVSKIVMDGFKIQAASTSNSADVTKRMRAFGIPRAKTSASPSTALPSLPLVTNSVVSFGPDRTKIGLVVAVDAVSSRALVQSVGAWPQLPRNDQSRAIPTKPVVWVPVEDLWVISKPTNAESIASVQSRLQYPK